MKTKNNTDKNTHVSDYVRSSRYCRTQYQVRPGKNTECYPILRQALRSRRRDFLKKWAGTSPAMLRGKRNKQKREKYFHDHRMCFFPEYELTYGCPEDPVGY